MTDLLIRQKCEAMIEYGYVALRQFPKFERHVLAARRLRRHYATGHVSLERIGQSVRSWVAHASHADAMGLRTRLLGKFCFIRRNA